VGSAVTARSGQEKLGHVVFIAACAAIGGFLFGYDSAVINGAVTGIQQYFRVGATEIGIIVASALLGSAAGAWAGGRLADRLGRVRTMQVAAVVFAVSSIGQALPTGVAELTGWRVLAGIAIGIASVTGPAYIAEISPPLYRGRLGSFQQLAIVLGIAVSQLANYVIARIAGGNVRNTLVVIEAWQWMLGVCVVPALIFLLAASIIPESPRFLVAAGRVDDARRTLREVEGEHTDVEGRLAEIRSVLRSETRAGLADLRGGRFGLLPIVWAGIVLSALQQLVGINVIFYYSASLWQSVGIDQSASLLISFSSSLVNLAGTFIAISQIDRIGRRPLLMIGSTGMALALGTVSWTFGQAVTRGGGLVLPSPYGIIALVAANVFVLFFALSWGVVVWVLLGEMFPNRIRALALSVAAAAQWLANWLVTVSFPALSEWNLSTTYLIYACFAVASLLFVVFVLRETKGRRLEDMG
jgi:SP family sugar:H+ symporter-like MFS transporter